MNGQADRDGDNLRNAEEDAPPAPLDTREGQLVSAGPLRCEHCDCPVGSDMVLLEATRMAERVMTLVICGPCWVMLLAAIELELAGAGPGGHMETHSASSSSAPGRRFPRQHRRDASGRWLPR